MNREGRRQRQRKATNSEPANAELAHGSGLSTQISRTPNYQWNCWPPCRIALPENNGMVERWEARLSFDYRSGSPSVMNLSIVTKLNVFKALSVNNSRLGFGDEWLHYESVSPFSLQGPRSIEFEESLQKAPPNLRPTTIQNQVPHHPWIDLFPLPRMRENIISAQDMFDEDQLCCDLLTLDFGIEEECSNGTNWSETARRNTSIEQRPILLIWGDPTDANMWEATEAFIHKWHWILEGCDEIIRSTNCWRGKRGEKNAIL